jgi:hypothetical protein
LVPLLNCNTLDRWGINSGRITQEPPRKYTKPTYIKKLSKWRPKARWKDNVQNYKRKMGIVNWRQVARHRDEWRGSTREKLIFPG